MFGVVVHYWGFQNGILRSRCALESHDTCLGTQLPLTRQHRTAWSVAIAVALSAEIRLAQPDARGLACGSGRLKFRYVVSQLETTL